MDVSIHLFVVPSTDIRNDEIFRYKGKWWIRDYDSKHTIVSVDEVGRFDVFDYETDQITAQDFVGVFSPPRRINY